MKCCQVWSSISLLLDLSFTCKTVLDQGHCLLSYCHPLPRAIVCKKNWQSAGRGLSKPASIFGPRNETFVPIFLGQVVCDSPSSSCVANSIQDFSAQISNSNLGKMYLVDILILIMINCENLTYL
jgi:hypothetical protein